VILVAGGTGRVGGEVVRLLTGRGLAVRILSRDPDRSPGRSWQSVEVVAGDVRDPASLGRAVAGVSTVVSTITGFAPGEPGPQVIDDEGNRALIRAARTSGAEHFVLVSIAGASPTHQLEIRRAKHQAEEELRGSGLAWTIVRPTVLMETWAMVVGDPIRKGSRARVFGRGDNPVNFVSADDVAGFVARAVLDPALRGVVLTVGGPENLTLNQVVSLCQETCARTGSTSHVPLPLLRLASVVVPRLKPDVGRLIEAAVDMDTSDMSFDSGELERRFPDARLTRFAEVARRDLLRESVPA
jgi:NADH dehydrogenase